MTKWNETQAIKSMRSKINRLKTCQKEDPQGNISLRVLADPKQAIKGVVKPRQINHECGFLLSSEFKGNNASITRYYAKSKPLKAMDCLQNKGLLDRLTAPILSHKEVLEQDKATNKHASKLSIEPILGDCGGHCKKCAGFPLIAQSANPHSFLFTFSSVFRANSLAIKGGNHA